MKSLPYLIASRSYMSVGVCSLFILTASVAHGVADSSPPEPGPENGGLKLRLVGIPNAEPGKEGFDVRVDLLNVTNREITIRTDRGTEPDPAVLKDLKDYVEASTSIESYPAFARWMGGVAVAPRTSPPPEHVLKAGEIFTVTWQTDGRRLKNKVANPNLVQNPEFRVPGLYSIHATIALRTTGGEVLLRSNEQLVPVGGSRSLPKHTFGHLWSAEAETKTGVLNLGSLHKIEPGDQFLIPGGKMGHDWKLTITDVRPEHSTGRLEPEPFPPGAPEGAPRFPGQNNIATLVLRK